MRRLDIARLLTFVREAPGFRNTGRWVGIIQRATGNGPGDAWCASFLVFVLTLAYKGKCPIPATGSCQALYVYAKANGLVVSTPIPGDVFLVVTPEGHAHHTGLVSGVGQGTVDEISGNTNLDGSREGYGVFERTGEHARKITPGLVFFRLPPEPA